ncbi:MAG: murein L,D-transpeptidase family protein [Bdellovibrionia bacterium]
MKRVISIFIAATLTAVTADAQIRKSQRSREAVEATRPRLEEELKAKDLRLGSKIYMRIFKQPRELEIWVEHGEKYVHFKTYPICYYSGYLGPKFKTGDKQAPEGVYSLKPHSLNPLSVFHLSMDVGYPNAFDRAHGRTGGLIMIHGDCVSLGCFAMTVPAIEEIYTFIEAALEDGQESVPVHIFPFRMSWVNMVRYVRFDDHAFWRELRPIYAAFEETKVPPKVSVENGKYKLRSD